MAEISDAARTEGPFSPLFHEAAELVGRRWTGAILYALSHGLERFSEIQGAIPGVSARLLTQRLRELEDAGVVKRVVREPSPRPVYELTEKGDALRPVLMALNRWAVTWAADGGRPDPAPASAAGIDCPADPGGPAPAPAPGAQR